MPLILNGAIISPGSTIIYNGADLQKIYCNDILVWQKYHLSKGSLSSYYAQLRNSTTPMIAASASPGDPNNYIYNRGVMSGDTLSWAGKGAHIKAKCNCRLTVSGTIKVSAPSTTAYGMKGWYYKNSSQVAQAFWKYTTSATVNLSYSINLSAGDTFSIRTAPESTGESFVQFSIGVTFSATPI